MALCIPHRGQRYDTVGDYQEAHGQVLFTISEMGNHEYEMLILLHELVEYMLVKKRGISLRDIDNFDTAFEAKRVAGNEDEPGHAEDCPYGREHKFAEKVERMVAKELGVQWSDYDKAVTAL